MCAPFVWCVTTAWSFQHSFPWHAKYFPNSHPVVSRNCVRLHATCKTKAVTMRHHKTLSYSILLEVYDSQVTHPEYTGKGSEFRRILSLLMCMLWGEQTSDQLVVLRKCPGLSCCLEDRTRLLVDW